MAAAPAPVTVPDGHEGHTPAAPDPDAPLVVKVKMGEFFFSPSRITAPVGKTIRFEVTNPGVVPHELLVGDRHAQDEAEKAMASGSSHGSHSHGPAAPSILLGAGESGVLEATFDTPGELLIGCHVPGHWAAGMKGTSPSPLDGAPNPPEGPGFAPGPSSFSARDTVRPVGAALAALSRPGTLWLGRFAIQPAR